MAIIIGGGSISNYPKIKARLPQDQLVICADSGTCHAHAMGLTPSLILGDMDSLEPELLSYYVGKGIPITRFPSDKDELDTELAIEAAIAQGSHQLTMIGVTGGRLDQTIANLHLLVFATQRGATGMIMDDDHDIFLITPQAPLEISGGPNELLSLIPLSEKVTQVNSHGLKWELTDGQFELGKPYGISNRFTRNQATISVGQGMLLAIKVLNC